MVHVLDKRRIVNHVLPGLAPDQSCDIECAKLEISQPSQTEMHGELHAYLGVDALYHMTTSGVAAADNDVEWDVPSLQILMRDDVAVAWGLCIRGVDIRHGVTDWSRGGRVFRKSSNGSWKLASAGSMAS
jgi:hypothetical protein